MGLAERRLRFAPSPGLSLMILFLRWSFNISDTPTLAPQGFNTTCSYFNPTTYNFAVDGYPVNAPCANPNVTFGLYPSTCGFTLNITHLYGNSGRYIESLGQPASSNADSCVSSAGGNTNIPFNDNGTWTFSSDDVRGQEFDARNNFGQSGYFAPEPFQIYPLRAIASSKCEFC
jgi:hypothetical protein